MKYHIWTEGCQMNEADSQRLASAFERMGYSEEKEIEKADVVVLNTCMIRQSAEDKALGRLSTLKPAKTKNPSMIIGLMGCMVGIKDTRELHKKLPYVDVFAPPSNPKPIIDFLIHRELESNFEKAETEIWQDGEITLPESEKHSAVSACVPIVYGCSHACAYCIVPYKRGKEMSRDPQEIMAHIRSLAAQGVKEIILLGQIIDRYGNDNTSYPNLSELLKMISDVDGVERIRFLTSHPNWMTDDILDSVASLPKVMRHIEVPEQAGNDMVLANMRRGYTDAQYRALIARIREKIPHVSIGTDIIVGFCGETESQFEDTYRTLSDLKLNVVHLARYSPRTGTLSERTMPDDVPDEEKWRRFRAIEKLQKEIQTEINAAYQDQTVSILFEEKHKGNWVGRTENMVLVFVQSDQDLTGKILPVHITWTGPWALKGTLLNN